MAHEHHHDHDHEHEAGGHDHGHGSGGHQHGPASFGMAFAVGVILNGGFVAAQIGFGIFAHSMALIADAVHNFGDVLGLLLAWAASIMARRQPTAARTYGWGRGTILASLTNAIVLLLGCGAIAVEAVKRFGAEGAVGGETVMWVAGLGILINGFTAWLFMRGRKDDLNVRGAFLHLASDAAVSAGVVLAGGLIMLTGWLWLDPVASLAIVAVIVLGTWGLLRDSFNLALDAVPEGVDLAKLEAALRALPGVIDVHDLHVWSLSTTSVALTVHLVQEEGGDAAALIARADARMRDGFRIGHATFQVETAALALGCRLRPAEVV